MKKLGITPETDKTVPQAHQVKRLPDMTSLKTRSSKSLQRKPRGKWTKRKNTIDTGRETDSKRKTNTDPLTTISGKEEQIDKNALDSRNLNVNKLIVKRKTQSPYMEELISRISRTIADAPADEIWIL